MSDGGWTLHHAPGTCSLAVHIALLEAGAHFRLQRVDFERAEQRSPAFLAINPKGRVPALVTEQGVLTETPALLVFIAEGHPQAGLLPADSDAYGRARLAAFNSYLCATVHVAHAHRRRGQRWADDPAAIADMRRKVPQTMGDCFALLEAGLTPGAWAMGEAYSIADPYLYTMSRWLEGDGVDTRGLPKTLAHRERMAARPAVQRALQDGEG